MEVVFLEISLILIAAAFTGTIAKILRQPLIPAYILAGVLMGPAVFNVITSESLLKALATFGIAFLLFLVGIELDIRSFMRVGKVAILAGVAQMTFAVAVGYVVIRLLGFESQSAVLLAFALGLSSTIIALKLIGEKKELDTLYGQIVIGILLTQDFLAVLFLLFFDVLFGSFGGDASLFGTMGVIAIKAAGLFALAFLFSKFLLKYLFTYLAKSSELLFLGAVCWCLAFSLLAVQLGFSIEVGALLAGVSLSFLPYSHEISYRVKSLRDFFLPIFFAVLGSQLLFGTGSGFVIPAVVLSAFVLLASPLLVLALLLFLGYRARTGFQTGIAISQISEFSFIIVALAFTKGVIGHELVSLVALIGLVTMTASTYLFEYSDVFYRPLSKVLRIFERNKKVDELNRLSKALSRHVILVGYNAMGSRVYEALTAARRHVVVMDNDPSVVQRLQEKGVPNMYGSMSDEEVLERLCVERAYGLISTVRSVPDTIELLEYAKHHRLRAKIIVTALNVDDAVRFYALGAHYVIVPPLISAEAAPDILKLGKRQVTAHKEALRALNARV